MIYTCENFRINIIKFGTIYLLSVAGGGDAKRKHVTERESGIIRNIDIRYQDGNKRILTAINIARCLRFVAIKREEDHRSSSFPSRATSENTQRGSRSFTNFFLIAKARLASEFETPGVSHFLPYDRFLRSPPRRLLRNGDKVDKLATITFIAR